MELKGLKVNVEKTNLIITGKESRHRLSQEDGHAVAVAKG